MSIKKSLELCQLAARGCIGKSTGEYLLIHHKHCTSNEIKPNVQRHAGRKQRDDRAQEGRDEMRVRERQQATTTTSSIVGWLLVRAPCTHELPPHVMPQYYCDFCERSFNDTAASRQRHLESVAHLACVKNHYESFRGTLRPRSCARVLVRSSAHAGSRPQTPASCCAKRKAVRCARPCCRRALAHLVLGVRTRTMYR